MPEIMNMGPLFPGSPNTPPPISFWHDLKTRALEMDSRPAFTVHQILSRSALTANWCMSELHGSSGFRPAHTAVFEFAHMTTVATSALSHLLSAKLCQPVPIIEVRVERDADFPLSDHKCIWGALASESLSAGDSPWPCESMKVATARVVSQRFLYRAQKLPVPCEPILAMTAFADLAAQAFALEVLIDIGAVHD